GVTGALAVPFLMVAACFLLFFRDPERRASVGDEDVVAPADGRVIVAGAAVGETAPPGTWQQVSIFLSPMDVHVNRIPVSGRVTRVGYTRGRFLPAYRPEAAAAHARRALRSDHL